VYGERVQYYDPAVVDALMTIYAQTVSASLRSQLSQRDQQAATRMAELSQARTEMAEKSEQLAQAQKDHGKQRLACGCTYFGQRQLARCSKHEAELPRITDVEI